MTWRSGQLIINLTPTTDGLQLQVEGELDVATSGRVSMLLNELDRGPRSVYVDLAAVRFADASGLAPFFDAAARRLLKGLPALGVAAVSRPVQRVIDLLADDHGVRAFALAGNREGLAPTSY